jgi:hypothetical protein
MLAGFEWTWASEACRSVDADPEIPPELKAVLRTALDSDPGNRFSTIGEFRMAVAGYLEHIWPGRSW